MNNYLLSIDEILRNINISKHDYYRALSISGDVDNDFHLHLKRNPDSRFNNNFSWWLIMAWKANLDIQLVYNHYKAITYMCAYLSKSEDECSNAMYQAAKEAYENNLDVYDKMKCMSQNEKFLYKKQFTW